LLANLVVWLWLALLAFRTLASVSPADSVQAGVLHQA
jgi:hypothetical protein